MTFTRQLFTYGPDVVERGVHVANLIPGPVFDNLELAAAYVDANYPGSSLWSEPDGIVVRFDGRDVAIIKSAD